MKKFAVYLAVILFTLSILSLSYSVYKKREFESSVSSVISEILMSNSDLSLSVDEYSYSVFKMQPAIIGVKIKNTKTLAEIKIERIDVSISEDDNGGVDIKYNVKNISLNDKVIYKGVDLTRYSFQRNLFSLMSGDGDGYINIDLYGKTSYKNAGKRVSTQNVIDVNGVFKLALKTDVSDFDYIKSDVVSAIFSGNDRVFYKTLSKLISKVSFINTAVSIESDSPEKIYYDASSLFLSMDRFDAKRSIPAYEKSISETGDISETERLFLKGVFDKVRSNAPLRVNVFIGSDYNISGIMGIYGKGVGTRELIQKNIDMTYSVD